VPEVTDQAVLDGITEKGCPFWWVIEYMNDLNAINEVKIEETVALLEGLDISTLI